MSKLAAAKAFIGEKVLLKKCFYVIRRPVGNPLRGYEYVTFDDPTGGGAVFGREEIVGNETLGPVRTILAFTSEDLAGEYLQEELRSIGEVHRVIVNTKQLGKFFRIVLGGQIKWITFDRMPSSAGASDRYSCWFIPVKFFAEMANRYVTAVDEAIRKMRPWLPHDEMVVELPRDVQDMLEKKK